MLDIRATGDGVCFWVYVQPRSAQKKIVGSHEAALKIKLSAPPVGGAANKQCIEVLAKALGVPKSTLAIISGQTNRRKQVQIRSKQGAMTNEERRVLTEILTRLAGQKINS